MSCTAGSSSDSLSALYVALSSVDARLSSITFTSAAVASTSGTVRCAAASASAMVRGGSLQFPHLLPQRPAPWAGAQGARRGAGATASLWEETN